jgi:hypothetical protein
MTEHLLGLELAHWLIIAGFGAGRSWIARPGRETAQTARKPNSRRGNTS